MASNGYLLDPKPTGGNRWNLTRGRHGYLPSYGRGHRMTPNGYPPSVAQERTNHRRYQRTAQHPCVTSRARPCRPGCRHCGVEHDPHPQRSLGASAHRTHDRHPVDHPPGRQGGTRTISDDHRATHPTHRPRGRYPHASRIALPTGRRMPAQDRARLDEQVSRLASRHARLDPSRRPQRRPLHASKRRVAPHWTAHPAHTQVLPGQQCVRLVPADDPHQHSGPAPCRRDSDVLHPRTGQALGRRRAATSTDLPRPRHP